MKHLLTSASIALISLTATSALAQLQPATIDPGRVQERYQIEQRPVVSSKPVIQVNEAGKKKPLSGKSTIMLEGVNVVGNQTMSDEDLKSVYADSVGKRITLTQLQAIADNITAAYRREGYILSRAVLPAQRIGDGVAKIQIIEGYVSDVRLQGVDSNDEMLQAYANNIVSSKPLKASELERYLLLMDDLSGMTARGTLTAASSGLGASTMVVNLEQKPVSVRANVNNRGSRFLGPAQGDVMVELHDTLGQHDSIRLRTIQSLNLSELNYYEASYAQPVGTEGTVVRLLGSFTETEPGNGLAPLNIKGDSKTFRLDATHPFLRSRRSNLFGTLAFTYRDTNSETFGLEIFDDNIRKVSADVAFDFYDDWDGINQLSGGLTQGLDVLGANGNNDLISRSNADSTFTYVTADAQRLQSLGGDFAMLVSASGQYSFNPLYASEEYAVGGQYFGSAYDPAELSGDSGLAARAELHFNADDMIQANWVDSVLLYGFYDIGKVWNDEIIAGEDNAASLASTGLGFRSDVLDTFAADMELAFPLTRKVAAENTGGDDMRVFFNLTYDY